MWYIHSNMPLPIDIGNTILSVASFYTNENFSYPKEYCFDTRIKAIEAIIKRASISICNLSVWSFTNYHSLPIKEYVYWDKDCNLRSRIDGYLITSKLIFNTELEALDYVINHPNPIFLERKKELL